MTVRYSFSLTLDGRRLQTIPVKESRIVEASVHDPYIILVLENKTIMALQSDESSKDISKEIIYLPVPSTINVSNVKGEIAPTLIPFLLAERQKHLFSFGIR